MKLTPSVKKLLLFVSAALVCFFISCSDSEYDSMPNSIQNFISQYWPNTNVESCAYSKTDATWTVILKNGPTVTFDNAMSWQSVDGNGMPLPQTLLYDRLPPRLYDYLESGEYLDQVFKMSRDNIRFSVELLNSSLTYDIDSGDISGK